MSDSSYWEAIERYFVQKRGNALILSPKDWPLVTSWQERGIPLEAVYEGIDQTVTRLQEQPRPTTSHRTLTLTACQAAVEDAWNARHPALPVTPSEHAEPPSQIRIATERRKIVTKVRSIVSQLQQAAQQSQYHCIHAELLAVATTLEGLQTMVGQAEDHEALAPIRQQVREVLHQLVTALEHALDATVRQELYAKAEAKLASHKANMSASAYQETLRITFLQELREAYPLPSFV